MASKKNKNSKNNKNSVGNKILSYIIAFIAVITGTTTYFGDTNSTNILNDLLKSFNINTTNKQTKNNKKELPPPFSDAQLQTENFNVCQEIFPNNTPISLAKFEKNKFQPLPLCFDQFAVVYSQKTKTPLVVVEKFTPNRARNTGKLERTNQFFQDTRINRNYRSVLDDYKNSGYDRGHMAPAADMTEERAMQQSFALTNIVPQNPENNREAWKKIEEDTRKYAKRSKGNTYIYTGAIFKNNDKSTTIGNNKVWVPSHLFKVIYDEKADKAWAYYVENVAMKKQPQPISYQEFVKKTGLELL